MATNIDERIVAAKFDASDFEKGVDKTIKKLDELKKSLNLKDATKGVEELAEKTEASTNSMSKSLDTLTERFTTFVGMIKQKILSGLADEVANVFLKMEQGVTGFIRSISSDQVSAGMSKYEQMLTSVRIMMSAGESEGSAYSAIGQLRDYSDQTSYSLSQMTDALSKLRAAGVDLDTATRSVEGIANACANAGINATDAQRAFFNLSQAYSSGVLKYTDYRSLELLNMTTADFKDKILEAAEAAGTLKKVSDGVYQTINKSNKKVTAGKKVTAQNLQDMLRYNFVTSDVMNELFGGKFFFDEQTFKQYKKKYKDLDEAIAAAKKDYGETAVNAYLAAREARSFTDVINTLKDVVSTGWSTTFEHLFGKLEQAKDFFTQLAEGELADVVYKIGEYRNAILGFWDDGVDGTGGGEVFRQTILNVTDALGTFLKTFLQVLPGFDELNNEEEEGTPILEKLGDKMFILSMRIRDASERIKEAANNFNTFMNTPIMENGPTRIELIRQVLSNLASVFSIIGKVVTIAFTAISKAFYTLSPIFDGFLVILEKITEPLVGLKDNTKVFDDVEHSINNILKILDPVADALGKILGFAGEIGAFIAQMAIDTVTTNIEFFSDALGILLELFGVNSSQLEEGEGVLDRIRKDFEGIKDACKTGLDTVKQFFGALLGDIKRLLGLTDEAEEKAEGEEGGIFAGLTNFFKTNEFIKSAKAWVDKAIEDVSNFIKSIPSRIIGLGTNIYDTLRSLFFTDVTRHSGTASTPETKAILTPLGEWVVKAGDDIKAWFKDLPNKILKVVGDVGDWINEVFDSWFGGKKKVDTNKADKDAKEVTGKDSEIIARFEAFIESARKSISNWFKDLPNKIQNAFKTIGDFSSKLIQALDEFLFGKKETKTVKDIDPLTGKTTFRKITTRYKTGFSKWLDGVIKDVKKFIKDIPKHIKSAIKGAGDLISQIVGAIFGTPEGQETTSKEVEDKLKKPFLGINLNSILKTIEDIGKEIFNQIARLFTGSEEYEKNAEWFSNLVAEGINWIRSKAEKALNWVLDFIVSIPTKIANFFKGEDANNPEKGPVGSAISGFGATVGKFITETLPAKILEFIKNATDLFGTLWDGLYDAIFKEAETSAEEGTKKLENVDAVTGKAPELSSWQKFVNNLGETISNIWNKLPDWIAKGIEMAIAGIDKVIGMAGDWIGSLLSEKKVEETAGEATGKAVEGMATSAEKSEAKEEPELLKAVKKIGERIKNLFVTTIPGFIQSAWAAIGDLGDEIFKGISWIFSGNIPEEEKESVIGKIAASIRDFFVEKLPAKIKEIWSSIKTFGVDLYEGISAAFTGNIAPTERAQAIANIVTNIGSFITDAFEAVKKLFNGEDWKDNFQGTDDQYKAAVRAIEDQQRQANERLNKDSEKPGFWSFVDGMKESLLDALASIGPAILNGLATALGWISKVATIIIDALTGKKSLADQIDDAYKDEKPELKEALKNIGESLKTFFLETIPQLIGSAFGSLAKNAPIWFSNFFGALKDAEEDEADKAFEGGGASKSFDDEVENATGVLGIVKNIFESLKSFVGENKEVLEIVGVVIALTLLFKQLSKLFGLADEFDAAGYTIKWVAITIAVTSIAGIMSFISSIVNSGDEEKIKKFEGIIDKIAGLFEKIAWVMGLFTAGKIADAVGDIGSSSKSKDKVGLGEKFLGGLLDSVTGFFKSIGVGAGAAIGIEMAGTSIEDFLSTVSDSFTGLASGVEDMLKILMPFIDNLVNVNDKLDTAISSATKMADLFTTLYNVFGELYTNATGNDVVREQGTNIYVAGTTISNYKAPTSIEAFMISMQQRLEMFMQLATFINYITNSLKTLDTIEDAQSKMSELKKILTSTDFSNFLTDIMNTLDAAVKASDISPEKLGRTQYIALRESGIDVALSMLSDALSVFSSSFSGLNEENVSAFSSALNALEHMYGVMGDVDVVKDNSLARMILGDKSLSALGREIKLFGMYMKTFYEYIIDIPGFKASEVKETQNKVDSVIKIAQGMSSAANTLEALINGELLSEFGKKLPELGTQIGQFVINMSAGLGDISAERVEMVAKATEAVSNMASVLSIFVFNQDDVVDKLYNSMSGSKGEKFASTLRSFLDHIRNALVESDQNNEIFDLGKEFAVRLFTGIQAAFDEDESLRIQITPVLKMDDAVKEQLRQQLSDANLTFNAGEIANSAIGANSQTDLDRVTYTLLKSDLDAIKGAIDTNSAKAISVSDLISAFTGMQIITDTGVLAGEVVDEVDKRIGEKIMFIENYVATGVD